MRISRLLKPALFIYECVRILIIAAFIIINSGHQAGFPIAAFGLPGAIFTLMALFIWLDSSRYKNYITLFIAGKCISIFSLTVWSLVYRLFAQTAAISEIYIIETLILSGDLFALAAILLILKSEKRETESIEKTETQGLEVK